MATFVLPERICNLLDNPKTADHGQRQYDTWIEKVERQAQIGDIIRVRNPEADGDWDEYYHEYEYTYYGNTIH